MTNGVNVKKQFSKWFGEEPEEVVVVEPVAEQQERKFVRRSIYEIVQYDIDRRQEVDWVRPHPDHNPLGAAYHDALDLVFKLRSSMRRQAQKYRRLQRERQPQENQEYQESNNTLG
jgi:hypothetical protein